MVVGAAFVPPAAVVSERGVQRVDQGPVARILPARPGAVHDVSEGEPFLRIGKSKRATGAKMAEAAGIRAQRPLRLAELKAEPEARGAAEHVVGARRDLAAREL